MRLLECNLLEAVPERGVDVVCMPRWDRTPTRVARSLSPTPPNQTGLMGVVICHEHH